MKYFVKTYGCQMNERDTEIIEGYLEKMNFIPAEDENNADIILLNTCCVRETAEKKVFGKLGELKKIKNNNPDLIIGICGCMVQQKGLADKIKSKAPYVNIIFGTHNIYELPELLTKTMENKKQAVSILDKEGEVKEGFPSVRKDNIKGYVNISYGCNNFCTYCIVPYVRGRERSREPESIISEIRELADNKYLEVMLLGQNVNSYGKDLKRNINFGDLILKVNEIPGIRRIRYMTSHPKDFSIDLIDIIESCDKVCKHYHLPLQAGSDNVLKKMNRSYNKEHYLNLINHIKKINPSAAITTDLIVGFPGETQKDFKETLNMVKEVRYDSAFTFIYSPRTGTPAAEMKDQISHEEKKERLLQLNEVQNKISREINEKLVGTAAEVLVESTSKTNKNKLSGRTETNKIIIFEGSKELIGKFKKVRIEKAQTWNLIGSLITK
jgi:tRNA-2-methylthio-N6-dimethylallyladenosine synthase